MKITILDIKTNKKKIFGDVVDVKPRGYYFEVVFKDNVTRRYSFKEYDVFQERRR